MCQGNSGMASHRQQQVSRDLKYKSVCVRQKREGRAFLAEGTTCAKLYYERDVGKSET